MVEVKIRNESPFPLPAYQTVLSAGMDLCAHLEAPITLEPGSRMLIPTGLFIELPEGFEAQIRPRSGLALKHGITVLNSPGTIDADYRGEIKVLLFNLSNETFTVYPGDRIAQLICEHYETPPIKVVDELDATERGAGGFGSTGFRARALSQLNK